MHSRQAEVDKAMSYLGTHEGDSRHKHIVDTYNSYRPLPKGYKLKYSDKWCAPFTSVVAIECGSTDINPVECGCERMINLYKEKGEWVENDAYVPQAGDRIFYDWDDSGKGDDTGWSDHVGIVKDVKDGVITVIEGNKSDSVALRQIPVNGKYIRGFGVPKYDDDEEPIPIEPKPVQVTSKKGELGVDLSKYQDSVNFDKVKADGYKFVILRSTTKSGATDVKFEEFWAGATKAGLKIEGVYKLCYAKNANDAVKEAQGVIKLLNGRKCDIWLDMENDGGQQIYSKQYIAQIITAFLTTCVNAGYDVGIYCNVDWYKNHITDDIKNICRFWIARYPKKDDGTIHEDLRTNYKGQVLWQFSSKGKVDGISGNVDLDVRC